MAVNNFHFKLDIEKEDHIPKFKLKQYDTAIFYASLYKNGLPYQFEGEKIKMFVKKADGTIVYQEDNITIQNDEVKINVKNQSLTASGLTYAELELRSTSGQVTTATFLFEVKEKVGSDKAIESITDICTLEKFDRYVGQAKKELDKFKQDLSKLEDLVDNKDKLEGQNTEAKVNIKELEKILEQANNIVSNEGKKVTGNNVISEGTTNGYTQDIKLRGRSLINEIIQVGNFTVNTNIAYVNIKLSKKLKPGKTYTYIPLYVPSKATSMYLGNSSATKVLIPSTTKICPTSFIYNVDMDLDEIIPHFYSDSFEPTDFNDTKVMIIEGNHTQSPPSYFEGIKSVGNGVENIEIISRKEDGNLFNGNVLNAFISNNQIKSDEDTKSIICKVNKNTDYIFSTSTTFDRSVVMGSDTPLNINSYLKYQALNVKKIDNTILFNSGNCSYICIYFNSSNLQFNKIVVNEGTKVIPYEEPKYSIRKLLYFDKATKSWKKPILKGINKNICDVVKKHSDNKYYFHQRCKQEPYTPGDENKDCITDKINTVKALSHENIFECLDISVRTFNPKTLVYIDSGVIESELEYYIPSSFVSSDSSISEKLENVDSSLLKLMLDFISHNHDTKYDLKYADKVKDFKASNSATSGYQKFPSGVIIQWGTTELTFDNYRAKGYLYYPVAFTNYCHCCGNTGTNSYGAFSESTGTVTGDNLSRGYAEAQDVTGSNRNGATVRIQWIAIGE